MSDSDNDSLLGMEETFSSRRRKTADKSRSNAMAYLDDQVKAAGKTHERLERKEQRIKQEAKEAEEGESTLDKAESLVNTVSTTLSGSKRRREIRDMIEGIDLSDDNGMDPERRAALATAEATGRSTLLGVRQTLKVSQSHSSVLYNSEREAMKALTDCLKAIDRQYRSNARMRQKWTKPLRDAVRDNLLLEFLGKERLDTIVRKHGMKDIPVGLCKWLFEVACSYGWGEMLDPLAVAAYEALVYLWENGAKSSEPIITVSQMVPRLESWFGLHWEPASQETDDSSERLPPAVHVNLLGLRHFLTLSGLCLALEHKGSDKSTVDDDSSSSFGAPMECLRALSRGGLDCSLHSGGQLLEPLLHLMYTVLHSVSTQVVHDKDELNKWMDLAVDRILDQCPALGPGAPSTEDEDDKKSWLCYSLLVRLFPIKNGDGKIHVESVEFKARLATRSLQRCLETEDWDVHLKSILLENGNTELQRRAEESLQWKAIASAYVGFLTIDLKGESLLADGPRYLGAVECACYCFEVGALLCTSSACPKEDSGGRYCIPEEADGLSHALALLELQSAELLKRVRPMSTRAHFRRVAFLLANIRTYVRHYQSKVSIIAGHGDFSTPVQQSIDSWLSNCNDSDDDNEESVSSQ